METKDQAIKDAQYRKGLSIAFFNSLNSAIAMCAGMNVHEKETLAKIIELRDFFLEEHKKYYAENIATIGAHYDASATIEKLKTAKTIDELKTIWVSLSEDERRDEQIFATVQTLKKQLS